MEQFGPTKYHVYDLLATLDAERQRLDAAEAVCDALWNTTSHHPEPEMWDVLRPLLNAWREAKGE